MARTPGRFGRARWIALAALGLAIVVIAVVLLRPPSAGEPTVTTRDVAATRTTEKVTVSLTGTLAAAQQAELSFGGAGKVTAVPATVGQKVTQGAVLAQIDDTTLRDAVSLASAQVNAARAQLTQVRSASGATSAQITSARAQVTSAEARLSSARNQLASATITAPFDGIVAAVTIAVGDQATGQAPSSSGLGSTTGVTAAQAAVVVVSPDGWRVNGNVGTADVAALKVDQGAQVTVQGTTVTVPAAVRTVGIVATTTSGATSFPVTLSIDGNPAGLFYGASVNVVVDAGDFSDVLTIPTSALTTSGSDATVQKVTNGTTTTTPITPGRVFGDRTEVTSGLSDGDVVRIVVRETARPQQSGVGGFGPPQGAGTRAR